jgi:hypothetical protein
LKLKDKKAEFTEGKWSALLSAAPTVRKLVALYNTARTFFLKELIELYPKD